MSRGGVETVVVQNSAAGKPMSVLATGYVAGRANGNERQRWGQGTDGDVSGGVEHWQGWWGMLMWGKES